MTEMSQENIIAQLEWSPDPNSEFENWWDYRSLPEAYKSFIQGEDGFKTKDPIEDPKNGGKWKYGVRKYFSKKANVELLKVWRVPWKDFGGGGSGGSKFAKKSNYRCIDFELAELDEARVFLKTNEDTTSDRYYEARNPIVVKVQVPGPKRADTGASLGDITEERVLIPLYLMKKVN